MRVLVTGASGYLAGRFYSAYSEELEVIPFSRSEVKTRNGEYVLYDGTYNSIVSALEGVDVVLHMATHYVAQHVRQDILPLIDANIAFGAQLLEAMQHAGVTRIVNIGTVWQKFDATDHRYANLYAATKQAFEELLSWYCDAQKFSAISLHLTDTYGRGDTRRKVVQLLVDLATSSKSLDMSAGLQRIELTHVKDVIAALKIACDRVHERDKPGMEVFSLLTGNAVTLRELAAIVENVSRTSLNINWGRRPYRDREVMAPPYSAYERLPGWSPSITLLEGVKELLDV